MARSRRLKLFEFVSDVVDAGVAVLTTDQQLQPDQARALMLKVARAICERNAKSTVYIPESIRLANMERNASIWAAYQVDGPAPNHTRKFSPQRAIELAGEFDLSPQQVYNIIREQREIELSDVQHELPGLDAS